MGKIYFEMNDKEKQLNLIANNIDYAICMFSEGLSGSGEYDIPTEEVIELQTRIGDNLMKAYSDIWELLKAVEEKEEDEPEEEEETAEMDLRQLKGPAELSELHDYEVFNIIETSGEDDKSGTLFSLRKELPEGGYSYRDLLISGDGNRYISEDY